MDRSPSGIALSIRLAREGLQKALSDQLDAHRNHLRLFAASCLHRGMRGKADPSDVVEETLLKVHESFHQFRGTTELERSPDAARMRWARAMQRVGGLLQGRVS